MSLFLQETGIKKSRLNDGFFFNTLFWLSVGGPILGFFGKWSIFFDIVSNFRPQETAFLAAVLVLLLIARRWKQFFAGIFVLLFCLSSLAVYLPTASSSPGGVSLLLSNIYLRNKDYQRIVSVIEREQPDLVVLDEIDKGWETYLVGALKDRYPVYRTVAQDDGYGIAIFSRVPLKNLRETRFASGGNPSFKSVVELPEGPLEVWAMHPDSPISRGEWTRRNEEYRGLAREAGQVSGPLVIIGDLNTSPWSPWFSAACGKKLKDAAQGFGLKKSWPAQMPPFLRLPLDHVLVSREAQVLDFKVLEDIGSDHLPILVRVGLKSHA